MICPNLLYSDVPRPSQPDNPSNEERQKMTWYALYRACHTEDYPFIYNSLLPPERITGLAAPGRFKGKRVGIIGGGLAGMATAFELRKLGFDITVFEASGDRIGGRIYTYYFDREKRLYGELGAMRIPVSHETTWHYINLFKLKTRPFIQSFPSTFIYLNGVRARNDPYGRNVMQAIYPSYNLTPQEASTPWQELGYYGIEAPVLEAPSGARSEILQVKPEYSRELLFWDSLSTRQMLEHRKLSQGAIDLLSNLFPIGGKFIYNDYVDFVQEYFPVGFWFMYEITGGMVNLPLAFYNSFTSRTPGEFYPGIPAQLLGSVSWRGGNAVTGIYRNTDGSVKLSFKSQFSPQYPTRCSGDAQYEDFDFVVCAVPFSVLRTMEIEPMFSVAKMQAIREVNYSPAQKSLIYFKRRFWEDQGIFGGGSYTDLPITTIWYPSDHAMQGIQNLQGNQRTYDEAVVKKSGNPGVLLASYSFNLDAVRLGNMRDEERFEKIKRNVEEVHGLQENELDAIATAFKTQLWDRDPLYRGAFCYFTPEQKKLFSWVMALPEYDNRVFFAGEHVSALHRWLQGALRSGMEAANEVACSGMSMCL